MENKDEIEVVSVKESDVPELIQEQFIKMSEYKNKLIKAKEKAEIASTQAKELRDSKTKLFKMKAKLEDIQETQIALAEATLENTEAQELSFEYQRVLANISKFLFGLGVTNITVNRCVVKELKMRIEQASEEEIDDMAREEILNVITQLKEQEDVIQKQIILESKLKSQNEKYENVILDINDRLKSFDNSNKEINEELKRLENDLSISRKINLCLFIALGVISIVLLILIIISFSK